VGADRYHVAMCLAHAAHRFESPGARAVILILLLALAAVLFGSAVNDLPFHTKGEPREALVVQRMFADQQYVLVLRNGDEIPSKPPLFHWLGTLCATALGKVDELAVRLPSVFAALFLVAVTTLLGFRWWGTVAGTAAGLSLMTMQRFLASATTARVDMVFAACVVVAVAAAGSALRVGRSMPLSGYFAAALAVLAKGPAGYVLPGAICGAYALAARRIPRLGRLRIAPALLISLLPVVWYLAAWWLGGQEFLDKLLLKENFYRVLDPDAVEAGHVKPLWFYGPALLGAAAPWSLCLPAALAAVWRERGSLDEKNLLLPLLWVGVTIALFSAAGSKRSVYLLPCFPPVALLIGHWVAAEHPLLPLTGLLRAASLLTAAIIASVIAVIALQALGVPALNGFELLFDSDSDRANLASLADVAANLRVRLLLWTAIALPLLAAATRSVLERRRLGMLVTGSTLIVATVVLAGVPMQRAMAARQTVKPFIERVRIEIPAEEQVYFFRGFDYGAVYYLERPIVTVEDVPTNAGRNRVWYFVWEQSAKELCDQVRRARGNARPARCREHDRYDFFGNTKREDLVLIAVKPRHARDNARPGKPR